MVTVKVWTKLEINLKWWYPASQFIYKGSETVNNDWVTPFDKKLEMQESNHEQMDRWIGSRFLTRNLQIIGMITPYEAFKKKMTYYRMLEPSLGFLLECLIS